jgi:maltokinase
MLPDGTTVLDGAGHPAFLRAWIAAADLADAGLAHTPHLGAPRVLPGEQSNTSVILPGAGPDGSTAMLKVFRGLSDGANPDVDVPRALAGTGWTHVPRPLAWMSAAWPDPPEGREGREVSDPDGEVVDGGIAHGGVAHGHLGVLSVFVPGATDGFELACDLAARGESFADLAEDLGAVIGQMHRALATALPVGGGGSDAGAGAGAPPPADPLPPTTDPAPPADPAATAVPARDTPDDAATAAGALRDRFAWASAAVPELHRHAAAVDRLATATAALRDLPPRQRVHGDLHLGQVLRGDGTWYVLDFEGEPLVPVAQRTRPDLALRDVAGMLRSIDYAAAVGHARPGWAAAARRALLTGYTARSAPIDPALREHLLRVLELDKALYEAVYEARNRPTWTAIPLDAVERLLG